MYTVGNRVFVKTKYSSYTGQVIKAQNSGYGQFLVIRRDVAIWHDDGETRPHWIVTELTRVPHPRFKPVWCDTVIRLS